jgi:hypothetical protein
MNKKKVIKITLILGLFAVCLGGWLLHLRIHPPSKNAAYLIPFFSGLISVFALPLFFCFRRTVTLGYIAGGFLVILGTITMAHFSIEHFEGPVTLTTLITGTLFADIAVLWGKFSLGRALYLLEFLKADTDSLPKGRYFRYPNMGWWWVHLAGMSMIYALGNILWK